MQTDPAHPPPSRAPDDHGVLDALVMGAGMSGLCMAVELRRAGLHRFVVLEQSAGLGGTWWDNRYPGAQVDVPAPLYSFSFAPNPHWQRRFAAAPEIQAYMQDVAARFGLHPHLRLRTRLTEARFDEASALWHIGTVCDGRMALLRARFFVCSTGPLSQPRWPDIPGLQDFAGLRLHSARWPDAQGLQGLRVGLIGTGSTAAQLVPPVAAQAAHLSVFQRTANWVLPRMDRPYTPVDRALNALPGWHAAVRTFWYAVLEWGRRGFEDGTAARRQMLRMARSQLRRQVPDATLRQRLQPPYPLGCKRIIYSNDYYPALARPNVALVTDPIERITPAGIRLQDGTEHRLDALVCATGFDVQHSLANLPVTGLRGRTLGRAWQDGPEAHLGLTVAGFPNLFLMLGPNTATGHTSTLLYIEPGARWAVQAMQAVQRRGQRWLAVKSEVQQRFNATLQQRLKGAVWSQCRSWYRADSGRNIAIWPGFTGEYRRAVQAQDFDRDFDFG